MATTIALMLLLSAMMGVAQADGCRAADVSTGDGFTCAVLQGGSARCWGDPGNGHLGRYSYKPAEPPGPLDFEPGRTVVQLATYQDFSCALLDDYTVSCWGLNDKGQLGLGNTFGTPCTFCTFRDNPLKVQVGTGNQAIQLISTGSTAGHTCAVVAGEGVFCWGAAGELPYAGGLQGTPWAGKPDSKNISGTQVILPSKVDLGSESSSSLTVIDMCAGASHTCVLTAQSGLKCWGQSEVGALGLGNITNTTGLTGASLPSVDLGTGRSAVQVACGADHTCAVLDNGALKCFGGNAFGQLGYGDSIERGSKNTDMGDSLKPVDVGKGRTVRQVAAGSQYTCALLDIGQVKCWGHNTLGELGHHCSSGKWGDSPGQMGDSFPAVDLGPGRTAVSISAGYYHSCAVLDDGSIKCWGNNHAGETGITSSGQVCPPNQAVDLCASIDVGGNISPSVKNGIIAGAVIAAVVVAALSGWAVWWWRNRRQSRSTRGKAALDAEPEQPSAQVVVIASDDAGGTVQPAADVKPGVESGTVGAAISTVSTKADVQGANNSHTASTAAPSPGALPETRSTPPLTSTGSSKTDARGTSTSRADSVAAPSSGIMHEGSVEGMLVPWSHITLGGLLGEGGFGKVYKARWRMNTVAVKVLNMKKASTAAIDNLHREALIMSELRHPCIARVFGVVNQEPHHALVMQYYPKGTLAKYLTTSGYAALELPAKLHIALQVASGMQFMHERAVPVLHGDLKAAKILLTGPGRSIVIADFGLSQAMLAGQEAAVASGALTYSISPPEVLNNPLAPRTRAADVYAFAIVLLEIYTGLPCFRGMRVTDIRRLVTAGQRPSLPADMPPCIANIIKACWSQDPASRPSFTDVVEQLAAAATELHMDCITDGTVTTVSTQTITDW